MVMLKPTPTPTSSRVVVKTDNHVAILTPLGKINGYELMTSTISVTRDVTFPASPPGWFKVRDVLGLVEPQHPIRVNSEICTTISYGECTVYCDGVQCWVIHSSR